MKRSLVFILILTLLLSLGGCKTEPVTPSVPAETTVPTATAVVTTEPPTEPPAPKAGLLLRSMTADEQDAAALGEALEGLGYEVLTRDAENDQSRQNEQAKELLGAGCEVLVLQPVMTSGIDVLLGELGTVPVLILDAEPELQELPGNVAVLCPGEEQAGAVQAQLPGMLPGGGDLNGDGKVSVLTVQGPEDHIDGTARAAAFLDALDTEIYTVLETATGEWTKEGGKTACAPMLAKYGPDVELIVTFGEDMALGALEAIENGGWTPGTDFFLISVGSSSAARSEVQQGRVSGMAAPDSEMRLQRLQAMVSALTAGTLEEQVQYVDYIPLVP